MDNVINIDRNQSVAPQRALNNQLSREQVVFVAGVLLTTVVPTIVYCAFRGPVSPAVFAGTALTGVILGVAKYLFFPYRPISIDAKPARRSLSPDPVLRFATGKPAPLPTEGVTGKRAA